MWELQQHEGAGLQRNKETDRIAELGAGTEPDGLYDLHLCHCKYSLCMEQYACNWVQLFKFLILKHSTPIIHLSSFNKSMKKLGKIIVERYYKNN